MDYIGVNSGLEEPKSRLNQKCFTHMGSLIGQVSHVGLLFDMK
jgi:hypothetical protein